MRNIAVPLHDGERVSGKRPCKNVDIREHRTESTGNDCGPGNGGACCSRRAAMGNSSRNIAAGEKRLSGQCPYDSMCNRIHVTGFLCDFVNWF